MFILKLVEIVLYKAYRKRYDPWIASLQSKSAMFVLYLFVFFDIYILLSEVFPLLPSIKRFNAVNKWVTAFYSLPIFILIFSTFLRVSTLENFEVSPQQKRKGWLIYIITLLTAVVVLVSFAINLKNKKYY